MFRYRSEWAPSISLAILLIMNLLFMTTGSAIPLRKGYLNERIVRQSSTTEAEFRISKSYALSDGIVKLKDSDSQEVLNGDAGGNLVPRFLYGTGQTQFGFEANSQTEEPDSGDSRSRRFLRGPGGPGRPRPQGWFLKQHQERRVMEGSSTTTTGQQTQPFYLGPPAPPGIAHNEKQDWNQDYAEPDVHPPSSN